MHTRHIGIILLSALLLAIIFTAGCIKLKDLIGPGKNLSINTGGWDVPQRNLTSGLQGTITNLKKAPLENASVTLTGPASSYSGLTDADGKYDVSGVPVGIYDLVVRKAGYENATRTKFSILGGRSYTWNVALSSQAGGLYGTITNRVKVPLENATISIIGNAQNYSGTTDKTGKYNITDIRSGAYAVLVQKAGHRNVTLANFTIRAENSYSWNVTLSMDCSYYTVNTSTNYVLRYGFSGTIYRGDMEFTVSYPEGAAYEVHPAADDRLSQLSIAYQAGNRMLRWKLDNSKGRYSYVEGRAYVSMNGTGTMRLYDRKEMSITDAASRQPDYLGSETTKDGRMLIDPSDQEIRAIAQQVKRETGSDDAWTVARALFLWLKNNTVYYIDPVTSDYSHLPLETLHSGRGKCDELSHLYISLLRAGGIPARFVQGYLVDRNPERYMSHRWVEFYDGEWVPVDVAGSSGNVTAEVDTYFAIQRPDHVTVFVDDGTSESLTGRDTSTGSYYTQPAVFPFTSYYDATDYNQMYIAVCSDGTRELKKEME
jgi:transglutaminase-like putative cysteine protease